MDSTRVPRGRRTIGLEPPSHELFSRPRRRLQGEPLRRWQRRRQEEGTLTHRVQRQRTVGHSGQSQSKYCHSTTIALQDRTNQRVVPQTNRPPWLLGEAMLGEVMSCGTAATEFEKRMRAVEDDYSRMRILGTRGRRPAGEVALQVDRRPRPLQKS